MKNGSPSRNGGISGYSTTQAIPAGTYTGNTSDAIFSDLKPEKHVPHYPVIKPGNKKLRSPAKLPEPMDERNKLPPAAMYLHLIPPVAQSLKPGVH
jgi:hypothetical protein